MEAASVSPWGKAMAHQEYSYIANYHQFKSWVKLGCHFTFTGCFLHAWSVLTPAATVSEISSHMFLKAPIIISSMYLGWEMWTCSSRSTRETPLPSSKVKHVHFAGLEPRYLVGKVPSVHVFENINKSHRYELIMKSQVAWVQKRGAEGWQLDTGLHGRVRKEWLTIPLAEDER